MMVVPYQTSRLQAMYQRILFRQLPVKIRISILVPPAIEPDSTYRTVVRQQLCQLVIHKSIIAFPVSFRIRPSGSTPCTSPRCVFTIPVDMGVIEMKPNTLFMTFVCQFFYYIALERGCIYNIIIGILGMKHREPFMVATCKADIFGSRCLNGTYPFSRTKLGGIETSG